MATAMVMLADGFEEIEAVTPVDVLRRAEVNVTTVGLEGRMVTGGHDVVYQADALLSEVIDRTFGAIVLPGGKGGAERLGQSEELGEMCRQQAQAGRIVAGICAAPGLALSPFGLLEQKRATCYPGFESYFPASARHTTEPVVVDGNLITSRGPGTALPFALQLVRELVSPQKAEDLAEAMQYRI